MLSGTVWQGWWWTAVVDLVSAFLSLTTLDNKMVPTIVDCAHIGWRRR